MPRCSSLPIIAECSQAAVAPKLAVSMSGGRRASTMGTAFHAYMKPMIDGSDTPDVRELAERYQCDVDELAMICRWGKQSWRSMARFFPDPRSEVTMEDGVLTGTCDVLSTQPYLVSICDHKSGWGDGDFEEQLRGYAWLATRQDPDIQEAYCLVLHVRQRRCIHQV